jgi:sugar lactone lactonase YvrE
VLAASVRSGADAGVETIVALPTSTWFSSRRDGERSGRRPTLALLIVAMSGVVAACGGDAKRSSPTKPVQTESSTLSRPESSERTAAPDVAVGMMTSVAGGGTELGDGGPATSAGFCGAGDVALDGDGNIYISDFGEECEGPGASSVRKVDAHGIITTVAGGTGVLGFAGDGGPATKAQLNSPSAIAVSPDGEVYIADQDNFRIRKVDGRGVISTVAGTGEQGHSGDGGPARSARLAELSGLAIDARGDLYVAEFAAVRKIDRSGTITTVAGTGYFRGYTTADDVPLRLRSAGDGGPATEARLTPIDVAVDRDGALYISDFHSGLIHKVNPSGIISTVAGSREATRAGKRGPATSSKLIDPWGIAVDDRGSLFIAEHHGERIREIDPAGTIRTIAGTGESGFSGDHGRAVKMKLHDPGHLTVDNRGLLYFTDYFNHRVWALRYRPG